MANTPSLYILPTLDLEKALVKNPAARVGATLDLALLAASCDQAIIDLQLYSSISPLWAEAYMNITSFLERWVTSQVGILRSQLQTHGSVSGSHASFGGSSISFTKAVAVLVEASEVLEQRLEDWEIDTKILSYKESAEGKSTLRPLEEILLEAMLMTETPKPEKAHEWLHSIVGRRVAAAGPPRSTDPKPLMGKEYALKWGVKWPIKGRAVGTVACVAAAYASGIIFVDSTTPNFGVYLSDVSLGHGAEPQLQRWYRRIRQSRYTFDQQEQINELVNLCVDHIREVMQDLYQEELERVYKMRDAKNAEVVANNMQAIEKGKQRSKNEKEARDSITNIRKPSSHVRRQREVLADMVSWYSETQLPKPFRDLFKPQQGRAPYMCLAYNGASFGEKPKCPVCEMVYIVPRAPGRPASGQDWKTVAELDVNRDPRQRGVCAEGIIFARCLTSLNIKGPLMMALRTKRNNDEARRAEKERRWSEVEKREQERQKERGR